MLNGCVTVGTEFARPPPDAIELGKTTFGQIVERFGKPGEETRLRKNGDLLRAISYTYANDGQPTKVPNTLAMRQIVFMFSGDVVVMESYASSFASDSTDFDERRLNDIVKGKTRCAEVVEILGRPAERAIYPATNKPGESMIGYEFNYVKRPVLQFKTYKKELQVRCDPAGVVSDVAYAEVGDR